MGATGLMYAAMGSSAISSFGTAYAQAQAIKAQGDYRRSVADTNARIANLQAAETLEAGDIAASRENLKTMGRVGSLRAAQGASGTDISKGSNVLTRQATEFAGNMDELQIRTNAARQAWGFKTQAIMDTYEGQFAKMTAANQAQQTLLSGGMQAISGPLSIEANYLRWSRYMGGTGDAGGKPFNVTTGSS